MKKLKLNKGEKRALKFLIQRETGQQDVDINAVIKSGNIGELKAMLAAEMKARGDTGHKKYEKTGGGSKHKNVGARGLGNNSNKLTDYRQFFEDDSD